ncbi:DMT family transporter [Granulosicoccus sp. 3-233]|uniref:DMT family transporter n=1 Tax=Granulosicoccus sp. 3-233 TaxID=3417969 RepID=UPI003D34DEC9
MSALTLGYSLMLFAFLCFAGMDTSAKWLVAAAIPALQVAWLRYLGHFICTVLVYAPKHGTAMVRSNKPAVQSLRALFLLAATCFNFTALQYLPLTTAIAIFFVTPLTVCLLSIPILGEKVGIRRLLAVMTGFLGVLIIVEPWSQRFEPAILLSLAAMGCASGYFVMSRLAAGVDSNATVQFYVAGIATVLLAPVALMNWVWPENLLTWGVIVVIGSLGIIGHSCLSNAHRHAEASVLAPVVYSQIIYIAVLSWLVFGQTPDQKTIIGTLIIVSSGLFIWFRERQAVQQSPAA